ncbi:MAG: type 4a pilus biogenesis protein PilO [bacterium]|nr:type 4a pilus biogenesis protein PilO [bacterium]MBK8128649.1 type 4a pilus biogenesis protein PilO [bacterium]
MSLNLRSPGTQKTLIVIFLMFGAVYAYSNFVYTPREDKATLLEKSIAEEQELLTKGKRIAANFQTVQEDYARLMESWDIAIQLLPTQQEMDALLKSISEEGSRRDVNFLLFRPMDPVEQPYYWEYPIQIRTLSSYHSLGRFVSAVAGLDRIVNVRNFKLAAYRPNKGRSPNTVEAEFLATIYVFKELGSPVGVTPKEEETKGKKRKKPVEDA